MRRLLIAGTLLSLGFMGCDSGETREDKRSPSSLNNAVYEGHRSLINRAFSLDTVPLDPDQEEAYDEVYEQNQGLQCMMDGVTTPPPEAPEPPIAPVAPEPSPEPQPSESPSPEPQPSNSPEPQPSESPSPEPSPSDFGFELQQKTSRLALTMELSPSEELAQECGCTTERLIATAEGREGVEIVVVTCFDEDSECKMILLPDSEGGDQGTFPVICDRYGEDEDVHVDLGPDGEPSGRQLDCSECHDFDDGEPWY